MNVGTSNTTSIDLAGRRVMVVEDEALIAMMLEDLLGDFGCEVAGVAGTMAQAMSLAEAANVDIALLDVNLSGEPVYPVMERLAARGVPFIFLSGYDTADLPPRFADAPLVRKPLKPETLRRAIQDRLAG